MAYYKVVAYIRADADKEEYIYYTSVEDAQEEVDHCESMQPENVYIIEQVHEDDLPCEPEIYSVPSANKNNSNERDP